MNIKTIPEANYLDGIQWNGGVAPLLTSDGTDILGFYSIDNGSTCRAVMLSKDKIKYTI